MVHMLSKHSKLTLIVVVALLVALSAVLGNLHWALNLHW